MRRHQRTGASVSFRVLVAVSDEIVAAASPARERAMFRNDREAWSRMSALERILAAEREDPCFDYAAN